jgi:hypothetical protein
MSSVIKNKKEVMMMFIIPNVGFAIFVAVLWYALYGK